MTSVNVTRYRLTTLVCTLAASLFLVGCGGDESASAPSPSTPATSQVTAPAGDYPLDVCVVTGEKLGSMGDPIVIQHEGREVRFCCKGCPDTFRKDPAKYLAKLDAAAKGKAADEHADHGH